MTTKVENHKMMKSWKFRKFGNSFEIFTQKYEIAEMYFLRACIVFEGGIFHVRLYLVSFELKAQNSKLENFGEYLLLKRSEIYMLRNRDKSSFWIILRTFMFEMS